MKETSFFSETTCRVCHSSNLFEVLNLGEQPLANAFLPTQDSQECFFPLTLGYCKDCHLVQIKETVPRERLFSRYVWITGTSASARKFSEDFCEMAIRVADLEKESFVVEIASNDGTFLHPFANRGFRTLGIDPAQNIAEIARGKSLEIWDRFWEKSCAEELLSKKGKVDFIFGRNVVAHASDLHGFIEGMSIVLKEGGVGAIEFHWSAKILAGLQYDSIYHEHLCYFGLASVKKLLEMHGLAVLTAAESPISGGALIVYFKKNGCGSRGLESFVKLETDLSVNTESGWDQFGKDCRHHAKATKETLLEKANGKIVGFGSSARSNTFLNFLKIDHSHIDSIIDNNPAKIGHYSPGSKIPIVSQAEGFGRKPDSIFALAWNFNREILETCKSAGFSGRYITAFPGRAKVEIL